MKTPLNDQITRAIREINKAMALAEEQRDWQTLSHLGQTKEALAQMKEETLESTLFLS